MATNPSHRGTAITLVITCVLLLVTTGLRAQQTRPCPFCALPTVDEATLSARTGAIVGLVVDTAHGEPAIGAVRLLKEHGDPMHDRGVATARLQRGGGFILVHIPPGHYDLFVKAIGMWFTLPSVAIKAGRVDTLTVRATNVDWPHGLNTG